MVRGSALACCLVSYNLQTKNSVYAFKYLEEKLKEEEYCVTHENDREYEFRWA